MEDHEDRATGSDVRSHGSSIRSARKMKRRQLDMTRPTLARIIEVLESWFALLFDQIEAECTEPDTRNCVLCPKAGHVVRDCPERPTRVSPVTCGRASRKGEPIAITIDNSGRRAAKGCRGDGHNEGGRQDCKEKWRAWA